MLKNAAIAIALTGLMTRVATIAAIEFAARIIHTVNKIEKKGTDNSAKNGGVPCDHVSQLGCQRAHLPYLHM